MSDADAFEPQKLREHLRGHGHEPPDGHEAAGVVQDEQLSRFLSVLKREYDPTMADDSTAMPGRAEDLDLWQEMVAGAESRRARESVRDGDVQTMRHVVGDVDQRPDISGIRAINDLKDMISGPAPMFYIWAEPGSGKTNFALFLAELWKRQQSGDAVLASNIRTLRETDDWVDSEGTTRDGWLSGFSELQEWIEMDGDPLDHSQRPKLFIFDEASSSAGGSGSAGYQTKQKMGPLAYKIRKYSGAMIVIGHDGKDVHPLIRELGTCIYKESKKEATFYNDVQNRSGVDEIMSVTNIPPTEYRYDDSEPTEWQWSDVDEDEYEPSQAAKDSALWTAIRCKEEEMSNREAAQFLPFSHGWVGSRWREYQQGEIDDSRLSRVQQVIG
jgi:hypothetical protein